MSTLTLSLKLFALLVTFLISIGTSTPSLAETLEHIFRLASQNDPQIRVAEAALKANLEARNIGKAALLPQINARATYRDIQTESANSQFANDTQTVIYNASLRQALFDLPSWYNFKSGSASANQAEADFLTAKQDLVIRTTQAYLNVLAAADTLLTRRSESAALKSQLEQAQKRYDVGLIAVTDVLDAQAAYDDVSARLVEAQGSVSISFESLGLLTGQVHQSVAPLIASFPIVEPVPNDVDSWVKLAISNSSALKSSTLARDSAHYNSKSRASEHLPTLSLDLGYTDTRPTGELSAFQFDTQAETAVLSLNVPIFSGGLVSAQRRQAYYQFKQAEDNLENTQRSVTQNTRSLYISTITTMATARARQQAIISSKSALEATRAGHQVGTRNLVDVLAAERAVFDAELAFSQTRYEYILNMLNLKFTAGVLNANDLMTYNQYLDTANQIPKSLLLRASP